MATPRGHDADRAPTPEQERWLAALAAGQNPTQAARTAGYRNPNSAGYDNLRSRLLSRVNAERIEAARRALIEDPDVEASTHPLGGYIVLLRGLESTRKVRLRSSAPDTHPETGKRIYRRRVLTVEDADALARVQAAALLLTLSGQNPRYW